MIDWETDRISEDLKLRNIICALHDDIKKLESDLEAANSLILGSVDKGRGVAIKHTDAYHRAIEDVES